MAARWHGDDGYEYLSPQERQEQRQFLAARAEKFARYASEHGAEVIVQHARSSSYVYIDHVKVRFADHDGFGEALVEWAPRMTDKALFAATARAAR
jgi:hypothetical protein